jgi:hypothetical protein
MMMIVKIGARVADRCMHFPDVWRNRGRLSRIASVRNACFSPEQAEIRGKLAEIPRKLSG